MRCSYSARANGGRPLIKSRTNAGRGSDPTTEVGNKTLIAPAGGSSSAGVPPAGSGSFQLPVQGRSLDRHDSQASSTPILLCQFKILLRVHFHIISRGIRMV